MDGLYGRCVVVTAILLLLSQCLCQTAPEPRVVTGQSHVNAGPLTLWYRSPAKVWTDALPIGNGRLGAMLFGRPEHDRYQLNDITVWSGGPMPNADRPDAYKWLPAIREALREQDYATATELVGEHMTTTGTGDSEYWPSYETLGDLTVDYSLPAGEITNYLRWLNLECAVSGVDFTVGGTTFHREGFASAPDHAIVSRLWSDGKGKISFTIRLSRVASATTRAQGNDTLVMTGDTTLPPQPAQPAIAPTTSGPYKGFPGRPARPAIPARPGNLAYEAQLHVETTGGTVRAEGDHLIITNADAAMVFLVAGTTYVLDWDRAFRAKDPHAQVTREMQAVVAKPYAEIKAAHIADYRRYLDRVSFHLPVTPASNNETDARLRNYGDGKADPSLAVLYYQMGRYLLISSSRPDNPLPSNSQGIWGDGLDLPWKCDYKSNITK